MQVAAEASKHSADIAAQGITISERNTQLDQRAWIGIVRVDTQGGEQSYDSFAFKNLSVAIHNSGKTPAIKLSGQCCMFINRLWTDPIPDYDTETQKMTEERRKQNEALVAKPPEIAARVKEFEQAVPSSTERAIHTGGVLAPGVTNNIGVAPSMKLGRRDGSGKPMTLYVLGKFTYNDIFAANPQHTTKFCLMHTVGNALTICPESNLMD